MSDDPFFARVTRDAQPLRFEVDPVTATRLGARIRARIASPTPSQILARWFRPVAATVSAVTLAGVLTVLFVDRAMTDPTQGDTLNSAIEISAAGDVYSVND